MTATTSRKPRSDDAPPTATLYSCPKCGARFPSLQALGGHKSAHSPKRKNPSSKRLELDNKRAADLSPGKRPRDTFPARSSGGIFDRIPSSASSRFRHALGAPVPFPAPPGRRFAPLTAAEYCLSGALDGQRLAQDDPSHFIAQTPSRSQTLSHGAPSLHNALHVHRAADFGRGSGVVPASLAQAAWTRRLFLRESTPPRGVEPPFLSPSTPDMDRLPAASVTPDRTRPNSRPVLRSTSWLAPSSTLRPMWPGHPMLAHAGASRSPSPGLVDLPPVRQMSGSSRLMQEGSLLPLRQEQQHHQQKTGGDLLPPAHGSSSGLKHCAVWTKMLAVAADKIRQLSASDQGPSDKQQASSTWSGSSESIAALSSPWIARTFLPAQEDLLTTSKGHGPGHLVATMAGSAAPPERTLSGDMSTACRQWTSQENVVSPLTWWEARDSVGRTTEQGGQWGGTAVASALSTVHSGSGPESETRAEPKHAAPLDLTLKLGI